MTQVSVLTPLAPNGTVPQKLMSIMLLSSLLSPMSVDKVWKSFHNRFPNITADSKGHKPHTWTNETGTEIHPDLVRSDGHSAIILDRYLTRFQASEALKHGDPDYIFFTNDDLEVYHSSQTDPWLEKFRDIIEEREAANV